MFYIIPDEREQFSGPEQAGAEFSNFVLRSAIAFAKDNEDMDTEHALIFIDQSEFAAGEGLDRGSGYAYEDGLKRASSRLETAMGWTYDEAEEASQQDYQSNLKDYLREVQFSRRHARSCGAMLLQVEGWKSPTRDHEPFKKYMKDQLEESIERNHYFNLERPQKLSGKQFREQEIAEAKRLMEENRQKLAKANRNDTLRKGWIKGLLADFPEWQNIK